MASTIGARTPDESPGSIAPPAICSSEFFFKLISNIPRFEAVASAGTPAVLPQQALREWGYAGKMFQTHGVATEEFIKLGGANVEGAVFTGEAFTIAEGLPTNDPFRLARDEFVAAYEKANGHKANIFAAHLLMLSRCSNGRRQKP